MDPPNVKECPVCNETRPEYHNTVCDNCINTYEIKNDIGKHSATMEFFISDGDVIKSKLNGCQSYNYDHTTCYINENKCQAKYHPDIGFFFQKE